MYSKKIMVVSFIPRFFNQTQSSNRIFSKDSKVLVIPNSESIDINNLEDWKKALRLFKR